MPAPTLKAVDDGDDSNRSSSMDCKLSEPGAVMESGGGGLSGDVNTDCSEAVVCSRPEVDAQPLAEHEESAETKFVAPAVLFACRAALLRGSTTSRAAFEKYSSAVDPALAKALEVVGSYNCEYGNTALLIATAKNNANAVKLLLVAGADTEAQNNIGNTALMFAVLDGPAAFVKSLLQAGASKEAKDRNGDTALVWAKRSGRPDLVALLDC